MAYHLRVNLPAVSSILLTCAFSSLNLFSLFEVQETREEQGVVDLAFWLSRVEEVSVVRIPQHSLTQLPPLP